MDNMKPQIIILAGETGSSITKQITAGLEEEGVFYTVFNNSENLNALELAIRAAESGILGTGIGVSKDEICVYNTKLPKNKPLFLVSAVGGQNARTSGVNAARLIKGKPFKLYE